MGQALTMVSVNTRHQQLNCHQVDTVQGYERVANNSLFILFNILRNGFFEPTSSKVFIFVFLVFKNNLSSSLTNLSKTQFSLKVKSDDI